MSPPTESPDPARKIPAWLMSVGFHVVAFIGLALLTNKVVPKSLDDSDRPVAIVLADDQLGELAYLGEPIGKPSDTETDAAAPDRQTSALPSVDALGKMIPAELALPRKIDGAVLATQGIVQTADLSATGDTNISRGVDMSAIRGEQEALRRAKGAMGPVTELRLFGGAPAAGRSFIFLIDRSKSMGSQGLGALAAAERELVRALQALGPKHKFQVVAYHHRCSYLKVREFLPATEENQQLVVGFLEGLAAMGATEHEMALLSTLRLEPDVIYLLTDGGVPALTEAQQKRIAKFARPRTSIHCIQFGYGPPQEADNFLQRLAARNRGGYRYVDMSLISR